MSRSTSVLLVLAFAVCGTGSGCAGTRTQVTAYYPQQPQRDIVFVIPGTGNSPSLPTNMRQVVADEHLPLYVETFEWTHGNGRYLKDQIDYDNIRCKGQELAGRISAYRRMCPDGKIYIVAHSAGSAIVLTAVESLPPNAVTRIVLLAPAVSAGADLRCALRASQQGVDAFISERDRWVLGVATGLLGTADRQRNPAAGRVGFNPIVCSPEDAALYEKFRQHPWDRCVTWSGNIGGHTGSYQPVYLQAYVLPWLR